MEARRGHGIPWNGVTDGWKLTIGAQTKPGSSGRAAGAPTTEPLLQPKGLFSLMWNVTYKYMPSAHGGQKRTSDPLEMPSLYSSSDFSSMSKWVPVNNLNLLSSVFPGKGIYDLQSFETTGEEQGMLAYTSNGSTQQAKPEDTQQPGLHNEFQASWGYTVRPSKTDK